MVQSVATLLWLLVAGGAIALISAMLMDEWRAIVRSVSNRSDFLPLPLPVQGRLVADTQRARVVRVRSQSAPQRAAA